jgi:hypothetical protein
MKSSTNLNRGLGITPGLFYIYCKNVLLSNFEYAREKPAKGAGEFNCHELPLFRNHSLRIEHSKRINLIEGGISLKKVLAFLSYTLLALLLAVACYGLSVQFMERESQKNEVRGVVKEKFQNLAVANILSQYEEEVQYWVRLEDGRRLQLPASLYKEIAKGEQLTLVKSPGSPIFLSR